MAMINSRFSRLTSEQIDYIKRRVPYPYNMLLTLFTADMINFFNRRVFKYKKGKPAIIHDKLINDFINEVVLGNNIKLGIKAIEEKKNEKL